MSGADLVVTALADGHRAADAIDRYLAGLGPLGEPTASDGDPRQRLIGDSSLLG